MSVEKGKNRWGEEVWESVWGEYEKVCWGVGEVRGEIGGLWGKVRGDGGEEAWERI